MPCRKVLLPLVLASLGCGDPVADHVATIMHDRPGREEALTELLFAKSDALPAVLTALRDTTLPARGRAALVDVLVKIHVREADARILPALVASLADGSPEVRRTAAASFSNMGKRAQVPLLLQRLEVERDEETLYELLAAIEVLDDWRLEGEGNGSPVFHVRGGEMLDEAQRTAFRASLHQIFRTATNDSLRGAAEEFLDKMAAQLTSEGDSRMLAADLTGSRELYARASS